MEKNLSDFNQRFGGMARLYGVNGLTRLQKSTVMIVGLGGVGSYAVEAIARSGVGNIILVDLDDVCITNINRQLCATSDSIGKLKGDVLKNRIHSINPYAKVFFVEDFLTKSTIDKILPENNPDNIDFIIDAIDSLDSKCLLIAKAKELNIPVITTGGAAGKCDPTQIKVDDLAFTVNDALLARMRKKLRRDYGFDKKAKRSLAARKKMEITAIYSPEDPMFPMPDGSVCFTPDPNNEIILDCESGMGSATHITGSFGFFAASYVINSIAKNNLKN
jgi:tRNA A37 threonylcarbamoyladenosine dehydratase